MNYGGISRENPGPEAERDQQPERTVVIHYHIFKNAGTSVDEMLRQNFGPRWVEQEFPGPPRLRRRPLVAFVRDRPEICALSSHSAVLPAPRIPAVNIVPVVFVRHPIDRFLSAYEFERTQGADTRGARLARVNDFAGYLAGLLAKPHLREARNFQTFRLAWNTPEGVGNELERAKRALRRLPFVGLVEAYGQSMEALQALLSKSFPGFAARVHHQNARGSRQASLEERIAEAERRLGAEMYAKVCEANADDFKIYEILRRRYPSAPNSGRAAVTGPL